MKKLITLLAIGMTTITFCMIYIIHNGVSLRLEPLIDPTLMSVGEDEIAKSVLFRLTPQFQPAHYVIIGFDANDEKEKRIVDRLLALYESNFHSRPSVAYNFKAADRCSKPCWIFTDAQSANQLSGNGEIEKNIRPMNVSYFTLSLVKFTRDLEVTDRCNGERRITFDCLVPLGVRESHRKLKTPEKYFFAKSYFEQDFFLFLEK